MQDTIAHLYSPITGKGLGICYSSLNKAGPLFAQAGMGAAGLMFYPNLCNGNLFLTDRILSIPQSNFTLSLGFVYNSQVTDPTKAWRFYHKKFVSLPNGNNPGVLEESDGHLTRYIQSRDQSNLYFAEDSLGGTKCIRFDSVNNFWILHDPETGIVEIYSADGLLKRKMDVTGRATVYEYDNNQQLSKITTPSGNHYQIVRYQNTITIMDADQNRALQEYTFDAQNRLLNSTTPDGYNIQYAYQGNTSLINNIKQSDNSYVEFHLTPQNSSGYVLNSFQLGQSKLGDESSYEIVRINYADTEHPNQATISNKTGNTAVAYDQNNDLTQVSRQKGYDVPDKAVDITTYTYTSDTRQLASITAPGNGKSTREYDAAFRNVLEAKTQPNRQIIDFVHNTDSETVEVVCKITYPDPNNLHLPAYERYVYEEIEDKANATISLFLRFKISPEGRVTEYRRLPNDAKRNIDT
ncbi:MAG: hypothetical protein SFW07_04830, partial [Gammaproteobacteria bacterium]|nr:hypothetical protein [Gammaproteobacteria bacterium]